MKYLVVAVVLFLGACAGESNGPAGTGAAGTGASGMSTMTPQGGAGGTFVATPPTGSAGTTGADECNPAPGGACVADRTKNQAYISVGGSYYEFSSPTCPGRICAPCAYAYADQGGFAPLHDCMTDSKDGTHTVYCDNHTIISKGTDCN